jgi:hypothetical protein
MQRFIDLRREQPQQTSFPFCGNRLQNLRVENLGFSLGDSTLMAIQMSIKVSIYIPSDRCTKASSGMPLSLSLSFPCPFLLYPLMRIIITDIPNTFLNV